MAFLTRYYFQACIQINLVWFIGLLAFIRVILGGTATLT